MLALVLLAADNIEEGDKLIDLIREYQNQMYKAAFNVVHNRQDAEDAVQNTFLYLIKHRKMPDPSDPKAGLLLLISVRQRAINIYNYNKSHTHISLQDIEDTAEQDSSAERAAEIADAVEKLQPDLQELLLLRYTEMLTTSEIAALKGMKPDTVQKKLKKARQKLHDILTEGE